jgi:dienelactone hydrolase
MGNFALRDRFLSPRLGLAAVALLGAALSGRAQGLALAQTPAAGTEDAGRHELNDLLDRMASRFLSDRAKTVAAIRSRADAETRQGSVRRTLAALIGSFPDRTPLHARTLGQTQGSGFRIRKVLFESQPNFPVTALVYVPDGGSPTRHPAILMSPGHYPTGKAADARTAALFARNGFVVLSYDPIGQGERLEYPDPAHPGQTLATGATGEHAEASLEPLLIGDTFARYEIWDAMRGVDYLSSLSEVDPERIGAFGCSGGGTITALTSALDRRIAAIGVACYITSFDALLPTLGPQDAEQSSPRFLSSGLDFPDLIEAAAPRPYAIVSTYDDMFPFSGARSSVAEARRFYAFFDPLSAGTSLTGAAPALPAVPQEPAWNPDTSNSVPAKARLQFITGPGHHGALAPILGPILSFFIRNLEPGADPDHPLLPASLAKAGSGPRSGIDGIANLAFQVTPTGQVATSYPDAATVFSLNRERAARILPARPSIPDQQALAQAVRAATGAESEPGRSTPQVSGSPSGPFTLQTGDGLALECELRVPKAPGRHPAVLLPVPDSVHAANPIAQANLARLEKLAAEGNAVLAITPRPSPPGTEETKSPLLGHFYLLSLRADLVGRTLLGMRVDDVIEAVDFLASRPDIDPASIRAAASGHLGLVLLHAALLDARLAHVEVDHVLTSYRSLLDAPMPIGAPEDVVPGVLADYDIPDIVQALGPRADIRDPRSGKDDLSQTSTPVQTDGKSN